MNTTTRFQRSPDAGPALADLLPRPPLAANPQVELTDDEFIDQLRSESARKTTAAPGPVPRKLGFFGAMERMKAIVLNLKADNERLKARGAGSVAAAATASESTANAVARSEGVRAKLAAVRERRLARANGSEQQVEQQVDNPAASTGSAIDRLNAKLYALRESRLRREAEAKSSAAPAGAIHKRGSAGACLAAKQPVERLRGRELVVASIGKQIKEQESRAKMVEDEDRRRCLAANARGGLRMPSDEEAVRARAKFSAFNRMVAAENQKKGIPDVRNMLPRAEREALQEELAIKSAILKIADGDEALSAKLSQALATASQPATTQKQAVPHRWGRPLD